MAMNNLFATWHHGADVDLRGEPEPDVIALLARAHERLAGIPELDDARRRIGVALGEVSAWAAQRAEPASIRSTAYAGSR